jgi:signal transduction histidine kinase
MAIANCPGTTYVSIHRDITGRKKTEQMLYEYRKNLKAMVLELTLAEDRERQLLAEDLHDGLGQAIFTARLKLDTLSVAHPAVTEVGRILEDMGRMVNTMTFELSPPVLRKLGLKAAVRSLARKMQERHALTVQIKDDGREIPLDDRVTTVLFRTVRELLVNVAKHAETDRASISFRRLDHKLQIRIGDRGKGFSSTDQLRNVGPRHFGLFSIRERLEYLGGTFKIRSAPLKGTTVTLTVPLASPKL